MADYPVSAEDFERLRRQREMAQMMRSEEPRQSGGPSPGMAAQFIPGGEGGAAGGEGVGTAGPWAALAAAVIANESWANSEGRRPDDFGDHMKDLASGKVLEYDAAALSEKMPGKSGEFLEFGAEMGNPEGVYKNLKKGLKPWEWF